MVSFCEACKRTLLKAASASIVCSSLILLAWLLSQKCPLRTKATVLGQHKNAIGNFTQFFADPHAAPGERNQRPRGGASEIPARPDPAVHLRIHWRHRWGLRPGHCTYPDAVYLDRVRLRVSDAAA